MMASLSERAIDRAGDDESRLKAEIARQYGKWFKLDPVVFGVDEYSTRLVDCSDREVVEYFKWRLKQS